MKRLFKDIWFLISGRTGRPRLKHFKPDCGQWDGAVVKKPHLIRRFIYHLQDIPRRIKSVKDRKFLIEQQERKEEVVRSGHFPFLLVSAKFDNLNFGVVKVDINPEVMEAPRSGVNSES